MGRSQARQGAKHRAAPTMTLSPVVTQPEDLVMLHSLVTGRRAFGCLALFGILIAGLAHGFVFSEEKKGKDTIINAADLAPSSMRSDEPMPGKWWLRRGVEGMLDLPAQLRGLLGVNQCARRFESEAGLRRASRSRPTASGSANCSPVKPATNRPPRMSPRASRRR